ncbi:HAD family hydrolase [Collinsella sp. An2]|uniref:HAD family hydrolase n=1 Tax=Collinsella sp. An2 TaxID=1965585 RepID=UPI001EF591BC|nr:HAD family hydrolase [Collinsella sp. An2]
MPQLLTMQDDDLASIKVIASDMDCTLLADDGSMPPRMFDRIRALDEVGVTFCAASGRPSYTLREMFAEVADRMALLSDNGAAIYCRGELIFKDLIDVPTYHELIDFTAADGRGFATVCGIDSCFVLKRYEDWDPTLRTFYKRITYLDSFDDLTADVNKYTVFFPDNDGEEVYASTYRDVWGERFSVTNAGKQWIDVMNKHVDKGQGMAHLCERLGVDLADAMAFGDTYNDVQMLETVRHSYVVANAEEHMHAHARFLAPSNNDCGVAQVIDAVLAAHGVTL